MDERRQLEEASSVQESMHGLVEDAIIDTTITALGGETEVEDTIMGSTVNLAARLKSAAPYG